jgi:hypothetical protein
VHLVASNSCVDLFVSAGRFVSYVIVFKRKI